MPDHRSDPDPDDALVVTGFPPSSFFGVLLDVLQEVEPAPLGETTEPEPAVPIGRERSTVWAERKRLHDERLIARHRSAQAGARR